jgi:hypothetical protein
MVCGDESSLAGGEIFVRKEREATSDSPAPQGFYFFAIPGPDSVGGIFDEGTSPLAGETFQIGYSAVKSSIVNGNNRCGRRVLDPFHGLTVLFGTGERTSGRSIGGSNPGSSHESGICCGDKGDIRDDDEGPLGG